MRKVISLLALCALVFPAMAASVREDQAKLAARAWVSRGGTLGARLGAKVKSLTTLVCATDKSTNTVYVAGMEGLGTVFLATDTTLNPVIAFTSATNDFSTIDERSPLWALLSRAGTVSTAKRPVAAASSSATAAATAASENESLWASLIAEGANLESAAADTRSVKKPLLTHAPTLGDVRVEPLVQSKWNQSTVADKLCYNRFTPDLQNGERALCGCVATAMSQIMRYHEFPTASRDSVTRTCYIDATAYYKANNTAAATKDLMTQAGLYDWSKMVLVPADSSLTDEEADAIGKLTSDAGISVNMSYDRSSTGGSGAFMMRVPYGFKSAFGYASADYYDSGSEISADSAAMERGLFANLDAGYPVLMGVSGTSGGHAIVGDGYGYKDAVAYVHLNMGWSGQSDFWYNLPDIDSLPPFDAFDDMVINIFPDASNVALLTGRVTDSNGEAVSGATVSVYDAYDDTQAPAATVTTSASGVYGVSLAPGTYNVEVVKAGFPAASLSSISLPLTTRTTKTRQGSVVYDATNPWLVTYTNVEQVVSIGNSYGNDVTLPVSRAQMAVGDETRSYATLDAAVEDARALCATGTLTEATIEILASLSLEKSVTNDFPCTITTASDLLEATPQITRVNGASLRVLAGGSLTLSSVAFAEAASTAVVVEAGGQLRLESGVTLGVPATTVAIETADAEGLVLAGVLESGFTFNCLAAQDAGCVFAATENLTLDQANEAAALIENAADEFGEVRGVAEADGSGAIVLKWQEIPVPLASSVGYFIGLDGSTNTAARFDRLIEKFQDYQAEGLVDEGAEIVVNERTDLSFKNRMTITSPVTLRGASASVEVASIAKTAGFDVLSGGVLTLKDIAFKGFKGDTFLKVAGGEVILASGARLDGIQGTNTAYGPNLLKSGAFTIQSGAVITNGFSKGAGGGLYAVGGRLNLEGGLIASCSAVKGGGGVFATLATSTKTFCAVSMAGDISFSSNTVYATGARQDLLLEGTTYSKLTISAPLFAAARSIALVCDATADGGAFATYDADAFSDDEARSSARAFVCANPATADAVLSGQADEGVVRWSEATAELDEDERDLAVVKLTFADGREAYYAELEAAFQAARGDFTAEVLVADVTFSDDLVVTGEVTLTSAEGLACEIARRADAFIQVEPTGSLTLTNISYAIAPATVAGSDSSDYALIYVRGGALTLADGATVSGPYKDDEFSEEARSASAVVVYAGGTFTMESGSRIRDCLNESVNPIGAVQSGVGGGVLLDTRATGYFRGGTISNCRTASGAAVYVCNKSVAYVSGDFTATDNVSVETDTLNNIVVEDLSTLYLAGDLSASDGIGVTAGDLIVGDTNLVATVEGWRGWELTALTNSAAKFVRDADTRVHGFLVTNATETAYVVWSTAVEDGAFAVGEEVFYAAGEVPELPPLPDPSVVTNVPTAIAFQSIERLSETTWRLVVTNVVPWCWYRLLSTDDLTQGFTTTNDWAQTSADAPAAWTNDVEATGASLFWKAEGKEGLVD